MAVHDVKPETTGGSMGTVEALRPKGSLLRQLDGGVGARDKYVVRWLPVDVIEPDPDQPRKHFDPTALDELAESLRTVGQLQEAAVYPLKTDDEGMPVRYRLIYGERRWRAAKQAGLELKCEIRPKPEAGDLAALLLRIEQQDHENSKRAALSAVEEAHSISAKLAALQEANPTASRNALVEEIANDRQMDATTVWRLLGLLDAPHCLKDAILKRRITSREVAFLLSSAWKDVQARAGANAQGKREVQFRTLVQAWAAGQGLEPLTAKTLTRYAKAHGLDPEQVKKDVQVAGELDKEGETAFAELVTAAVREKWTVQQAREHVRVRREATAAGPGSAPAAPRLYERTHTKGKARFIVHLDRLSDPEVATPGALVELAQALRAMLSQVEGGPPGSRPSDI